MSNKESVEARTSTLVIKSTVNKPSRQEGILGRIRRNWANLTSAASLFSMSAVSPLELPQNPASGLDTQAVSTTPFLLHGDAKAALTRQNVLLVAEGDTSEAMLKRVAEAYFVTVPFNEQSDRTNIFGVRATEPLGCNQQGECNQKAVGRVIDRNIANSGRIYQETVVVVRREYPFGSTGWTPVFEPNSDSPSIYTYAAVVIPEITGVNKDFEEKIGQSVASSLAHETAHAAYGINHEGADIMTGQEQCNPPVGNPPTSPAGGGMCYSFNEQHKKIIRERFARFPGVYGKPRTSFTPKSQAEVVAFSVNQDEEVIYQLPTMELTYPRIADYPVPTRWMRYEVRQEDGPGISLVIGDVDAILAFIRGERTEPAPDVANGKGFILLHDQLVRTQVCFAEPEAQPDWNSSDWFTRKRPNGDVISNCASITQRTPKSTAVMSNATEARIASNTPTVKWNTSDNTAWYDEVQLSGDTRFDPNPDTATSFVYWNLVHAGQSQPKNSWTVPKDAALAPGKYYWRVRERVQGSGTPAKWSEPFAFEVVSPAQKALNDIAVDAHVINQRANMLTENDVRAMNIINREAIMPNRAERRKNSRFARATA